MYERRDFREPRYKSWRLKIYRRDGFKCCYPNCGSKQKINAHHIKKWASFPDLRYEVSNGITLCKMHHDMVTGKEEQYEELFTSIIGGPKSFLLDIRRELRRRLNEEKK